MTQAVIDGLGVALATVGVTIIVWIFAVGLANVVERAFR